MIQQLPYLLQPESAIRHKRHKRRKNRQRSTNSTSSIASTHSDNEVKEELPVLGEDITKPIPDVAAEVVKGEPLSTLEELLPESCQVKSDVDQDKDAGVQQVKLEVSNDWLSNENIKKESLTLSTTSVGSAKKVC